MFSTEEYNEQTEAYLKGKLSAEEAAIFEEGIRSNPSLKEEYLFQKTVVSGIQAARKAELKARLNDIQIPATKPVYWKVGAVVAVIVAVSLTGYYASVNRLKSDKAEIRLAESDKLENLGVVQETESAQETTEKRTEVNGEVINDGKPSVKGSRDLPLNSSQSGPGIKANKKTTAGEQETGEALPSLPDVHAPDASAHEHVSKDLETPDHSITSYRHVGSSVSGVEVVKSKKHKFHYRYFDNKLYLYGNFDTKTYDILELNTSNGQKLYLRFENNYYGLEHNKTEISRLEAVKSKETLRELEEIQKK